MNRLSISLHLGCAFVLLLCQPVFAESGVRTFDRLAPQELDELSKVTFAYYQCVAEKLEGITVADASSAERAVESYPPHIRIVRQQCRIRLLNVEKQLYGFGLNAEFITNYVNTLRDDVVHYALDSVMKKHTEKWAKESAERVRKAEEQAGRGAGFGLFTKPGAPKNAPDEPNHTGN